MAYYSEGNFLKRFLSDTLGFRGGKNLASWGVAGALAYFYIYLPEQKKAQDIKVRHPPLPPHLATVQITVDRFAYQHCSSKLGR